MQKRRLRPPGLIEGILGATEALDRAGANDDIQPTAAEAQLLAIWVADAEAYWQETRRTSDL
jgi:hypothetical protein